MRAADGSLPITFAGRPRASPVATAPSPGVGSALLAWAADLVLGLPMIDASPVRVEPSASLRLSSAPRRPRPRPPGLVRSNRQPRELRADPSSPVRSSSLPGLALPRLSTSRCPGKRFFVDRTPLLRFSFPFSTCRLRCAVRGWNLPMACPPMAFLPIACPWPASGRSRFDVSLLPTRALLRDRRRAFARAVFRRRRSRAASLKVSDVSEWFTLPQTRRIIAAANSRGADQLPSSSIDSCRCAPGEPVRTLASDPNTRAVPLQSAARTGSCTVAFLRRGVPLPSVSGLRSLAGRMVLPSVRPAALMGFCPSQSCPATGEPTFLPSRAHVPFAPRARPD